jgi:hypothetical protein
MVYMTLSPTNREMFVVALRVLTQYTGGVQPAAEDVQVLKQFARADEKRLRVDSLACAIIQRELSAEAA